MNNNTTEKRAAIDFDDQLSDSNEKSGFKLDSESIIMVIGVGGAGGNAVNHMQHMDIRGVNFVACNTDIVEKIAVEISNTCFFKHVKNTVG